jgi:hypothetical protein
MAGDSHLQKEKTATTGTLRGYPGTAHCYCGRGKPSSRRENSNHKNSYRIPRYCTLLLLLLWQGTAIFKKRKQQPQELLEDTQVQHIAPAASVAGDSHLQEGKTSTTGTLT